MSSTNGVAVDSVLVDELESNLGKFAHINDVEESYSSDGDDSNDTDDRYEAIEPYGPEPVIKGTRLDGEDGEPEAGLQLLFTEELPRSPLPLVSAMKGSREKQGAPPRKSTVSWAAEVYDPIPNSLSHSVKSKQKKCREDRDKDTNYNHKKNGKKGQKGNSSRGVGGKDKKQFRKAGGRSDRRYKTMDASEDLDDFNVGSPDYCGSSFRKNSVTKFHYSLAEAS